MRNLRALALAYEIVQDRILAVVNPGQIDSWSFWLTRRIVRALLEQVPATLERSSTTAKQVPAEYRSELAAFEREAALAKTASAMTHTDNSVMRNNAAAAELGTNLTISDHGSHFTLSLQGERGGQAAGTLGRVELQRILQMLQNETTRAGWWEVLGKPPVATAVETSAAKQPVRH